MLLRNKNLSLEELREKLGREMMLRPPAEVYAYILRSVNDFENGHFVQEGSAPNFQGGFITLCTCKHSMRSSRQVDSWAGNWIAGFTSHRVGENYLFCLMQVKEAFESFRKLWYSDALTKRAKEAKSACISPLRDLYRPSSTGNEFSSQSYAEPMVGHSHRWEENSKEWRNDITYQGRSGRRPALIVGDPERSFLWSEPLIYFSKRSFRNHRRYSDLAKFLTDYLRPKPRKALAA